MDASGGDQRGRRIDGRSGACRTELDGTMRDSLSRRCSQHPAPAPPSRPSGSPRRHPGLHRCRLPCRHLRPHRPRHKGCTFGNDGKNEIYDEEGFLQVVLEKGSRATKKNSQPDMVPARCNVDTGKMLRQGRAGPCSSGSYISKTERHCWCWRKRWYYSGQCILYAGVPTVHSHMERQIILSNQAIHIFIPCGHKHTRVQMMDANDFHSPVNILVFLATVFRDWTFLNY